MSQKPMYNSNRANIGESDMDTHKCTECGCPESKIFISPNGTFEVCCACGNSEKKSENTSQQR